MINKTGLLGERAAAHYLREKGYTVMAVNFYSRTGEVDIIAEDFKYTCFIEVKTRTQGGMNEPRDSVGREKQRKIKLAADFYLLSHDSGLIPRFDIIEVLIKPDMFFEISEINHIEGAFI